MNIEPEQGHTVNHILPFALFGFLAPIATYLIAVSNLTQGRKTAVLSLMAGLYALLFVVSYRRLRAVREGQPEVMPPAPADGEGGDPTGGDESGVADERSFRLVLEHQLEETIRSAGDRPLSVLAVGVVVAAAGIEDGASGLGQKAEIHAAEKIRKNLRAMDFLARSDGGEFLIVLPTANEAAAGEIAGRIERSFTDDAVPANDGDNTKLRALIGISAFEEGVESAELLVSTARNRKREAEARMMTGSAEPAGEYLN